MKRLAAGTVRRLLAVALVSAGTAGANTITVNSTADVAADDGQCTLREAIIAANTNTASGATPGECAAGSSGLDTIAFNIAGAGVHTIAPASPLPVIAESLTIDGYTQPGTSPNTAAFPGALDTVLLIELSGANSSPLSIAAPGTTIRGLVLNHNAGDGIDILPGVDSVTIAGNFIGSNPAGTAGVPGATGGFGVRLEGGNGNKIGGPNPADRNLISGDLQGGIFVGIAGPDATLIQGNYVGPDVTGTAAIAGLDAAGILVRSAVGLADTTNTDIIGNLISGNPQGGIENASTGGVIRGNLIGVQRDGVTALGNGNFGGVYLDGASGGAQNILVGGSGAGQPNVIALNNGGGGGGFGITVISTNNLISQNSIYGHTFKDISLNGIGTTVLANDACDADSGPGNNKQNYPVITSASIASGNATLSGTLNSTASRSFHLEFFSSAACSPSGNGGGQTFIGSADVTTNGSCTTTFGPLAFPVPGGQTVFTATATDATTSDTSEFSACVSPAGAASANLAVSKNGAASVKQGANLTYTITVSNAGPDAASNAQLTDTLPPNTTFVSLTPAAGWDTLTPPVGGTGTVSASNPSLASGASGAFTLVVKVDPATPAGTLISNTASVSSATADPDSANNASSSSATVTATSADLAVTKNGSAGVAAGANLTYTIHVSNAGPDAASNAQLTDTLPTNTTFVSLTPAAGWDTLVPPVGGTGTVSASNPSFASGASGTFTLVVNVNAGTPDGTIISNTASVATATADPNPDNDTSTSSATVGAAPPPSAPQSANPIPTLADWALGALAIVLALAGAARLRSKRSR